MNLLGLGFALLAAIGAATMIITNQKMSKLKINPIHINAFNFPIWGMLEKIAVNLMAGMPAIVKPATLTCYLTEFMVREIIGTKILPEGALQLICGSANGILDHITSEDVVTFTGSASTGKMLKAHPKLIDEAVPFKMEADSLNASILGNDSIPGTTEFDLFIKEKTFFTDQTIAYLKPVERSIDIDDEDDFDIAEK